MKTVVMSVVLAATAAFTSAFAQTTDNTIRTDSVSRSTTDNTSNSTTTVKSPPPTAVAPAVTTINNDVCAVVASGAVQTQIFGISMGGTMRDMNCERIKLSKNLFDMGMKVAAVATLCQDERVFAAMLAAGTPCPVDGKIGEQAKAEWDSRGVLAKANKAEVGNYATKPSVVDRTPTPVSRLAPVPTPSLQVETPQAQGSVNPNGCDGYRGFDPIALARVCGK
jgi:hypothetical protein